MKNLKYLIFAVISLGLIISGCQKDTPSDHASMFTDDDIEVLAGLDETDTIGNSQAMVEVIPVPAPRFESTAVTPAATTIAVEKAAAIITPPKEAAESAADSIPADRKLSFSEKVQVALKNADYYDGKIDGVVGKGTREAIKSFQEEQSLKADGMVGPTTWDALKKYYYRDSE